MALSWQNNRRLSEFSTFGIGGPIRYFAEIRTSEQMAEAFLFCRDHHIPFFILGKGSNCLFSDSEFNGAVLLNRIDFCQWSGASVSVGGGYSFSLLGIQSAKRGLSGLEFASGIPASVGGAVFMNAGAHGAETCERLDSVSYLDSDGNERKFFKKDLDFSYRSSPFQKMSGAILSASFLLTSNLGARQVQLGILQKRMDTQPLKDKSAGCVFRNPESMSAGALIDRCGLKGERVGDAVISEVHANFIVNRGSAKAADVIALIQRIQRKVYEETGVCLEPEIRMIGNRPLA